MGPSLKGNRHKRRYNARYARRYEDDYDDDEDVTHREDYRRYGDNPETSGRPTAKEKYKQEEIDIPKLSDEQMLLLPSVVKGFAVSSKRWCKTQLFQKIPRVQVH